MKVTDKNLMLSVAISCGVHGAIISFLLWQYLSN
jgi:hypothetical protein